MVVEPVANATLKKEVANTPGPWAISGISQDDGSISIAKDRIVIAYATNASSIGDFINATLAGRKDFAAPDTAITQFANARLIAAAPELLDALKDYDNAFTDLNPDDKASRHTMRLAIIKARAAIMKATTSSADAKHQAAPINPTE